jgi:RNA polymerase sigma factor (TIGR02999 family)
MSKPGNITELLSELHAGSEDVLQRLLPMIRRDLRRIADYYFNKEHAVHNLDASDLVQEILLRLLLPGRGPWHSREHFFALAAINVRRRLIEHGRALRAQRRGGGAWKRVEMDDALPGRSEDWCELLDVDQALRRLEARSPRQSRVVEYRLFAGMTIAEIASKLGVCENTVKSDWILATAFFGGN